VSGFWLTVFVSTGWIGRGALTVSSNLLSRAAFLSEMYSASGDNEDLCGWSSAALERPSDEYPWLDCSLIVFMYNAKDAANCLSDARLSADDG
jgi:hypothetical protein